MVDLRLGDCVEVMDAMEPESIDSIVTDPPYGLEFMGKEWDKVGGGRTSKPGLGSRDTEWVSNRGWNELRCKNCGHLSHGGSPCACENPLFERADDRWLRMQLWHQQWAEGALRVLKPGGHLLAFGGTRTYHRMAVAIEDAGFEIRDSIMWLYATGFPKSHNLHGDWEGWGTALKPAHEPVVVARKPLIGTVVANVRKHGTGAVNIDGARIGTGADHDSSRDGEDSANKRYNASGSTDFAATPGPRGGSASGRWTANIILDESRAAELDEQSGQLTSGSVSPDGFKGNYTADVYGKFAHNIINPANVYADTGGASRFFYVAKPNKRERSLGLGGGKNVHPTVKPVTLMRYLVRLVTPPDGIVLDPFIGSGTTGMACAAEGFECIGIDQNPEYLDIASKRIAASSEPAPVVPIRPQSEEQTLFEVEDGPAA